jgi:TPR repeat protein
MYEMGWGTTVDKTKALDLYQQALAAGNNRAQQNIDRLEGKSVAVE